MARSVGWDSSVGVTTFYRLDGLVIESRWRREFRTRPDRPWTPTCLLRKVYCVIPGGKATGAWS